MCLDMVKAHELKQTNDSFGKIDILFNNAGLYKAKPIEEIAIEEWNLLMGVNVTGTFLGMKHVLPIMKNHKSRSIKNASSVAGLSGSSHHALYGASKGAIRIMTKDVAMEVSEHTIRVNSVHPGTIKPSMGDDIAERCGISGDELGKGAPLNRIGTPQDIANMVLFLASDESSFITAQEMIVDDGFIH